VERKEKKTKSFHELLKENKVVIPIIQREYAHGRRGNERVLKEFLKTIRESPKLHLDLIYGVNREKEFIPIDGQQRLTLLFLLHTYRLKKTGKGDKELLKRFSYRLRSSTREFCTGLVEKDWKPKENLKEHLKDQEWFNPGWDGDPTIESMLEVLNEIHAHFKEGEGLENIDGITFTLVNINELGLDPEELYIKINSTGRQLTEFEKWKARFEHFLTKESGPETALSFSETVDGKLTDFFWKFFNEEKKRLQKVEEAILNYFSLLTEMKSLEKGLVEEEEEKFWQVKELWQKVWKEREEVEFLLEAFKRIDEVKSLAEELLASYSFKVRDNSLKISTFEKDDEDKEERSLFDRLAKNYQKLSLTQKLLLHSLIEGVIRKEKKEKLSLILRVLRNYTSFSRGRKGLVSYDSFVGREEVKKALGELLPELFKAQEVYSYLKEEKEKLETSLNTKRISRERVKLFLYQESLKADACKEKLKSYHQLEDHPYVQGNAAYFLKEWDLSVEELTEKLYRTFEKEDEEIIPAVIIKSLEVIKSEEDACPKLYPLEVGDKKVFFGRKRYWEFLLREEELKELWLELFKEEDFKGLREKWLEENRPTAQEVELLIEGKLKSLKLTFYPFVNLSEVFRQIDRADRNVFLLPPDEEELPFCLLCSEKLIRDTANSYHPNPFLELLYGEEKIEMGKYLNSKEQFYSKLKENEKSLKDLLLEKEKKVIEELFSIKGEGRAGGYPED
jgi:hypothetical protein